MFLFEAVCWSFNLFRSKGSQKKKAVQVLTKFFPKEILYKVYVYCRFEYSASAVLPLKSPECIL